MSELVPSDGDETSSFLARTLRNIGEGLTGIAASDKKDWSLSVGYILQRVRSGRFLETLKSEWDSYRDKGRIKDDYIATEQHQECLQEILDFLDNDSPDHIRFNAMKQVFLNTATEQLSDRDSVLPQQYMRICRSLNSTEVLILKANYTLANRGHNPDHCSARQWLKDIAENSVLKHISLVESQESSLMQKCLIGERTHGDRSGVVKSKHFRMTDLGYALAEFMDESKVSGLNGT